VIIAVVSGKGGAGKTTIATSLAHILAADYYDLDVDSPNGEHFLHPKIDSVRSAFVHHPAIDSSICNGCAVCTQECRFNALYKIGDIVYLNDHLCHSCNLCREVCPIGAISYKQVVIGEVRSGFSSRTGAQVIIGDLQIGSTRGTALIHDIALQIDNKHLTIIDGPPGNSCAAVAAIKPADRVVLVIEPTPFGIHDMLQTLQVLRELDKPLLTIANKSQDDTELKNVLADHNLTLGTSIPLHSEYQKELLRGEILSRADAKVFRQLEQAIMPEVNKR
jgi:MinD superfamily P-loop ATPase